MTELIILIIFICVIALIAIYSLITGISPMPSSKEAIQATINLIQKTTTKKAFTCYELGAGWGGLSFSLAKTFPEATIIAFELSPIPYCFLKCRLKLTGLKNVMLRRQNFLNADFKQATFLYAYLYRSAMPKIERKFLSECVPSSCLISNSFMCPSLKLNTRITLNGFLSQELLIYMHSELRVKNGAAGEN